jgi:8-oxo-dGTP diphosphatase
LVDERDEAARCELSEETGVDVPSLLTRFGAYGDPRRDPRMNVVNLAYLAVLRDVGAIVAGTDAAHAALVPASASSRRGSSSRSTTCRSLVGEDG